MVVLFPGWTSFTSPPPAGFGTVGALEAERQGTPLEVEDATIPTPATPPEIVKWQQRQRVTQFAVPVLAGANIVCNSWLVQSYRTGSTLKGVARRLLPG